MMVDEGCDVSEMCADRRRICRLAGGDVLGSRAENANYARA